MEESVLKIQALIWTGNSLQILDQRQLPEQLHYDDYTDAIGVTEAIKTMRVRGAPAIGIAAAYAVALSVKQHYPLHPSDWRMRVNIDMKCLAHSRPTAVNLSWALIRMQQLLDSLAIEPNRNPCIEVEDLALKIHADDIAANYTMGELGADIIADAKGILTHCNAGALATGGYGTALGVIRSAYYRQSRQIYADETRPWLQGARLTVWELAQDGIPSTLIADSAAAWLMNSQAIQWIVVGADRIAANGDVANKIGTYGLAVLARYHHCKLMVVAPSSTLDGNIASGQQIVIEQREQNELLPECYSQSNLAVNAWNPVFDVTPAELISVIVTERGVIFNPSVQGIRKLL
ncbi:MAG: hypothetical protein RL637_1054 [Pseudomonadota bacterium]|jgi:methylthioribose-1-phosphate isomerase